MVPSLPGRVGIIFETLHIARWNSLLSLTVIAIPVALSQQHTCVTYLAVKSYWAIDY